MHRFMLAFSVAIACVGCATAGQLREKHPASFDKLASTIPECGNPQRMTWDSCDVAATILESNQRKAVVLLIAHAEKTFTEVDANLRRAQIQSRSLAETIEREKRELAEIITRIDVAAVKNVLGDASDPYAKAIRPELDLLVVDSPSSLESLRNAHVIAMRQSPPESSAGK